MTVGPTATAVALLESMVPWLVPSVRDRLKSVATTGVSLKVTVSTWPAPRVVPAQPPGTPGHSAVAVETSWVGSDPPPEIACAGWAATPISTAATMTTPMSMIVS